MSVPSKRELWASMSDAQLQTAIMCLPQDVREEALERAGIMQHLGGLSYRDASLRVLEAAGKPKAGFVASVKAMVA